MARIEGRKATGIFRRFFYWAVRRKVGKVTTPTTITAHHGRLLFATGVFEAAQLGAKRVPAHLKQLASVRTATLVGCPF